MPEIRNMVQRIHQPVWSGWRLGSSMPLLEEMNLFAGHDLGNALITNMQTPAALVADSSGLITHIGIFASFDSLEDYEEFWSESSFDFVMGGRTFHSFKAKDVQGEDKTADGIPIPTHEHGFMGWIALDKPLEIPPRMSFHVVLHSSKKLVETMLTAQYSPRDEFAAITIHLDTDINRSVQ
jgi:hypothetical protein